MQALFLSAFATTIGWIGQNIGLPLFLATFEDMEGKLVTGPYFVLAFCAIAFVLPYVPLAAVQAWRGELKHEWVYACTCRGGARLFFMGACNGMTGLLLVYSASTTRVPGALQPILRQSTLLFTVIGSRIALGKRYSWRQLGAVGLVLLGIGISLVPTMEQASAHANNATLYANGWQHHSLLLEQTVAPVAQALWSCALVLGCAPIAAMNLMQESLFDEFPSFSVPFLQLITSLWQPVVIGLCWWTDILPGFGTSGSIRAFGENIIGGSTCIFTPAASANPDRCRLCAPLCALYLASYLLSYFFGSHVTRLASANLQSLLVTTASACTIFFWFGFPSITRWSGGRLYSTEDVLITSAALVPLFGGILAFRLLEAPTATTTQEEPNLLPVSAVRPSAINTVTWGTRDTQREQLNSALLADCGQAGSSGRANVSSAGAVGNGAGSR